MQTVSRPHFIFRLELMLHSIQVQPLKVMITIWNQGSMSVDYTASRVPMINKCVNDATLFFNCVTHYGMKGLTFVQYRLQVK